MATLWLLLLNPVGAGQNFLSTFYHVIKLQSFLDEFPKLQLKLRNCLNKPFQKKNVGVVFMIDNDKIDFPLGLSIMLRFL